MSDQRGTGPGPDLHDLAAPYALDALDLSERRRFEEHLSSCTACREEVAELQEAAVALSEGMEHAPPAALRRRVLDQVAAEAAGPGADDARTAARAARRDADAARTQAGRRSTRRGWWLAAAAAVVIGAGTWGAVELLDAPDPASRIVQAQDAREYDARTPEGEDLTVIASAAQDAAVLRLPSALGRPPEGKVYQAWYVGTDGAARSAGVLDEEAVEDGESVLEGSLAGAAAVAVTVEPEGGSQQPTSDPFVVVPLG